MARRKRNKTDESTSAGDTHSPDSDSVEKKRASSQDAEAVTDNKQKSTAQRKKKTQSRSSRTAKTSSAQAQSKKKSQSDSATDENANAAVKTKKKTSKKKTAKKAVTKKTEQKKATTKKATAKKKTTKKSDSKKTGKKTETAASKKATTTDKKAGSKKKTTKKAAKAPADKPQSKKAAPRKKAKSEGSGSSKKSRTGHRGGPRRMSMALPEAESGPTPTDRIMVVNEEPGQECRIAFLDNNKLDEYYVERASSATVVGNIYKARVTNIEPAIQAAFVDFGLGESGFLHVSDLHPRYFPDSNIVEQVGKKIPRRQRPPIQDALQKGQEVLVQVLKQGIGSKGPTVTSYLSIPGRLMVMMPDMDRIGVSRKVADDNQRRKMRELLDSLDLPANFGFIVRTAGFSVSKTELKRDVAYLNRLWQQMERRMENTGAPCLLYAESDLLIRTIRDVVDGTVKTILIDDVAAFERLNAFLKVSSPKTAPDVRFYNRSTPIFTAFDVERQVDDLHNTNVPLQSGGALVIEQTEALVAIDVNSGRSRSARDSETNAFETNKEAVDEICRQLRLRDLGGVIINDLIDMRVPRNREEIESRFMQNLKRDRAKSTVLPISEFGLVEMTRQRMRPNTWRANYQTCGTCGGTGELPRADSVAASALRRAAIALDHNSTSRIELVSSDKVASILMNARRTEIARMEERSEKKIDIRISDSIADERVDLYAYDRNGADIDSSQIQKPKNPSPEDFPLEVPESLHDEKGKSPRKRRRRRRGKTAPADATAIALAGGFDLEPENENEESIEKKDAQSSETKPKRKRRRRGRGSRDDAKSETTETAVPDSLRIYELARELKITSREIIDRCTSEGGFDLKNHMSSVASDAIIRIRAWFTTKTEESTSQDPPKRPTKESSSTDTEPSDGQTENTDGNSENSDQPKRRSRRRRGRRGRNKQQTEEQAVVTEGNEPVAEEPSESADTQDKDQTGEETDAPRKRRRRRRGGRRRNKHRNEQSNAEGSESETQKQAQPEGQEARESDQSDSKKKSRSRSRSRSRRKSNRKGHADSETAERSSSQSNNKPKPHPQETKASPPPPSKTSPPPPSTASQPQKPRTLYGGRIRRTGRT